MTKAYFTKSYHCLDAVTFVACQKIKNSNVARVLKIPAELTTSHQHVQPTTTLTLKLLLV